MYYKQPPNQETLDFTIAPRGYGKAVAANKQTKGKKLPMAALPNPKTQNTVKPENIFKGELFRLPGSRTWYTVLEEPTINRAAQAVVIKARNPGGQAKRLYLDQNVSVYTKGTPTR